MIQRPLFALAVAAMLAPLSVSAQSFLPPNTLRIPIGSPEALGIGEAQFNQVLDRIQAVYGPIIEAKGGVLVINRLWGNDTVNASAQRSGNRYIINMYGGLARHKVVTQDGFALVACHEIGHHLGGAPKINGMWATNEGGSDYFANAKCLRKIFADPASSGFSRFLGQDAIARDACVASFPASEPDQALCVRGTMAGVSVSALLAGSGSVPDLSTPDPSVVSRTNDRHPAAQCRLDTYFQASRCVRSAFDDLSDSDPAVGACTSGQGFTVGLRPRCWYLPPDGESQGLPAAAGNRLSPRLEALRDPDVWRRL